MLPPSGEREARPPPHRPQRSCRARRAVAHSAESQGTPASGTSLGMRNPVTWAPASSRARGLETRPGGVTRRPDRASHRLGHGRRRVRHRRRLSDAGASPGSSIAEGADPATQGRAARARRRGHATAASSHPSTITCGETEGVRRIGRPQATQGGDDVPPRQGPPGLSEASERTGVPESRGEVGVQNPEHPDGARDPRWRDDRMTGRRCHGRRSALNGVVHQGRWAPHTASSRAW